MMKLRFKGKIINTDMDYVVVNGMKIDRPPSISRARWLELWEIALLEVGAEIER
jgi:hypothetical protein